MTEWRGFLGLMLVVVLLSGSACGKKSNNDLAPNSVAGRSYQVTVSAGTGLFATSGVATLAFSVDGTYTTTTTDTTIVQDNGTYTLTKLSADTLQIVIDSDVVQAFQSATYIFTYTGNKVGSFTASLPTGDTQSGTFQQL